MNVNGHINIEDTKKQTHIYYGKNGSSAFERSVTNVTGGLKPGLLSLNLTLTLNPYIPYKTNSVNKRYPRPINVQH